MQRKRTPATTTKWKGKLATHSFNIIFSDTLVAAPTRDRVTALLAVSYRTALRHGPLFCRATRLHVLCPKRSFGLTAYIGSKLTILVAPLAQPVFKDPIVPAANYLLITRPPSGKYSSIPPILPLCGSVLDPRQRLQTGHGTQTPPTHGQGDMLMKKKNRHSSGTYVFFQPL